MKQVGDDLYHRWEVGFALLWRLDPGILRCKPRYGCLTICESCIVKIHTENSVVTLSPKMTVVHCNTTGRAVGARVRRKQSL